MGHAQHTARVRPRRDTVETNVVYKKQSVRVEIVQGWKGSLRSLNEQEGQELHDDMGLFPGHLSPVM